MTPGSIFLAAFLAVITYIVVLCTERALRKAAEFWKGALTGAAIVYLLCGFAIGSCLKFAVPATSYAGVAYITMIWPAWVLQPWTGWTPPIPRWSFSFEKRTP